jgi:uncharacterized protein (DUF2252 family)
LMDLKEAVKTTAPHTAHAKMPSDHAQRVDEGARHLSPYLGGRMRSAGLDSNQCSSGSLCPRTARSKSKSSRPRRRYAGFLAAVVGKAQPTNGRRDQQAVATGNCTAVTPNRWKRLGGCGPASSNSWQTNQFRNIVETLFRCRTALILSSDDESPTQAPS